MLILNLLVSFTAVLSEFCQGGVAVTSLISSKVVASIKALILFVYQQKYHILLRAFFLSAIKSKEVLSIGGFFLVFLSEFKIL